MIDVGIDDGDLLVIKQQSTANDGEIVVALVDDDATLKRIYHKGNKIILHPENKEMEDIIVTECQVQGVLVSCIKRY
jgi:repressor LexA